MQRKTKQLLIIGAVLVLMVAAMIFVFVLPYVEAVSGMASGAALTLRQQDDGTLALSWPAAERADYYFIEVLKPGQEEPESLHTAEVSEGTVCILPKLEEQEVTLRVNTMVRYSILGFEMVRPGIQAVETVLCPEPPAVEQLQWTADPDADLVDVSFQMTEGDLARLYLLDEQGSEILLKTLEEGHTTVTFGENGELPMPEHGQTCTLVLESFRQQPGSELVGLRSERISIIREDLLGRDLQLRYVDRGDNVCTLTWNETKGGHYEVQLLDEETQQWQTLRTVTQAEELSYTSDHLKGYQTYSFRVVAVGGQTLPESGYAAVSETAEFLTAASVRYCTIWPMKELEVYASTEGEAVLGKIAAGSAHCVLEEKNGLFAIRFQEDQVGYVDSNYCMINLAEYLGGLCAYDITNSYSSIYRIHNYSIPYVTGTVVTGYQQVRCADGTYLVPLLYPTAQKLHAAGLSAWERGYRLKIYDSYRPNQATVSIYSLTNRILEDPVPGNIPAPTEEDPDKLLTYETVMTQGVYNLGYFLANGMSMHNLGVAVDLTLESMETGEEMPMQSAMHDLSCYSVLYRNNENANILAEVMKGAGFTDLISEWWHFQDDEIRKTVPVPALWAGVSPECWMADDHGWRYRNADGSYAAGCTLTIGEKEYSFDERGYVKDE